MIGAIRHQLANLTNANGRDARQTFWFWVLAIVLVRFAVSLAISLPMTAKMTSLVGATIASGQADNEAAMQKAMFDLMASEMPKMVWIGVAVGVVTLLLLCASTIRRLHDSDLPGWIVLIPGTLYAAGLAMMPAQMQRAIEVLRSIEPGKEPDVGAMMQGNLTQAALMWIPVIILIVIGVRASTEGPNKYGAEPSSF